MHVGRTRKRDRHLPPRLHQKHGAYYYVRGNKWERLSEHQGEALKLWAERECVSPSVWTVGRAMDAYLIDGMTDLATSTQDGYRRSSGPLREVYGDIPLDAVESTHIAQYLNDRTAKISGNREMALMSSVYAYAMRLGFAKRNPCHGVRRNKEKPRDRLATEGEIAALMLAARPIERAALTITLLTGLRLGDMRNLTLANCSSIGLEVCIGKSRKRVCFPWTPELREAIDLARGRRQIGPVLLTQYGRAYTKSGWESIFERWRQRAGVTDLHWHDLRAYALTWADRLRGREYARRLAVHARAATTDIYLRDRGVVEVEPMPVYWLR